MVIHQTDPDEFYYGEYDTCLFCGRDVDETGDSVCYACIHEYEEALYEEVRDR